MKNIIIGTTAINRPDLHEKTIFAWYNWIKKLDKKKYNVKWVINIDVVDGLSFTGNETKTNLKKMLKELDVSFVNNKANVGNFFNACQKVSKYIKLYLAIKKFKDEDTHILWLEDDWHFIYQVAPDLETIIQKYTTKNSVTNFSFIRNNYIHALAPCLISCTLFKELHLNAWKKKTENDPETAVGKYFTDNLSSGKYSNIPNLTVITKHKKHDEGFFESGFLKYKNSFYTYADDSSKKIIKDNYIANADVKSHFQSDITFIRITCGFSNDIGRKYMEDHEMKKVKGKADLYEKI